MNLDQLKLAALVSYHSVRHGQMEPTNEETYNDMFFGWKVPPISFEEFCELAQYHEGKEKTLDAEFKALYGQAALEWAEHNRILTKLDLTTIDNASGYRDLSDADMERVLLEVRKV